MQNRLSALVDGNHRCTAPPSAGIAGGDHNVGSDRHRHVRSAGDAGVSCNNGTIDAVVDRLENCIGAVVGAVSMYCIGVINGNAALIGES